MIINTTPARHVTYSTARVCLSGEHKDSTLIEVELISRALSFLFVLYANNILPSTRRDRWIITGQIYPCAKATADEAFRKLAMLK